MDENVVDDLLCDVGPSGVEACKDVAGEFFVACDPRITYNILRKGQG